MAEVLRDRGSEVVLAGIEFTDPRYADRFKEFPMPHLPRGVRDDPARDLQGHRENPYPRRCNRAGVRSRVHRLSHLVALDKRAGQRLAKEMTQ